MKKKNSNKRPKSSNISFWFKHFWNTSHNINISAISWISPKSSFIGPWSNAFINLGGASKIISKNEASFVSWNSKVDLKKSLSKNTPTLLIKKSNAIKGSNKKKKLMN